MLQSTLRGCSFAAASLQPILVSSAREEALNKIEVGLFGGLLLFVGVVCSIL